jgi:hypothetical protein
MSTRVTRLISSISAVPKTRGSVFGIQQTLLGLAWVVSLAAVTGIMAVLPEGNGHLR